MDDYPIFEDIFWPQKGDGVSVSLQLFLFEVLIYVTNGLKVGLKHTYSTFSQKKEGFTNSEYRFIQFAGCCAAEQP